MAMMGLLVGHSVIGRYLPEAKQVVIGEEYFDILTQSDDYIALFKPGRSVYKPSVGSEYDPARIYFVEVLQDLEVSGGEQTIKLMIHLETPIRRS